MSTTTHRPVRTIGIIGIIAGLFMVVAGGATWGLVTSNLSSQNITVTSSAPFLAGSTVNNPFSAFAQAAGIEASTNEITDGRSFADLDRDDPLREVAQQGAFLQASLFTSVIAYGVAALVIGMGVIVAGISFALTRIASLSTVRRELAAV